MHLTIHTKFPPDEILWGEISPIESSPTLPAPLANMGIRFEQWDISDLNLNGVDVNNPTQGLIEQILNFNTSREEWLYNFRTTEGSISILKLTPETPNLKDMLPNFAKKHTHSTPEVRLILDGEGIFTVWDKETPYELPVKKGSFMVIPADCVHTFQLTQTHKVTALRVFKDRDGWTPNYDYHVS